MVCLVEEGCFTTRPPYSLHGANHPARPWCCYQITTRCSGAKYIAPLVMSNAR